MPGQGVVTTLSLFGTWASETNFSSLSVSVSQGVGDVNASTSNTSQLVPWDILYRRWEATGGLACDGVTHGYPGASNNRNYDPILSSCTLEPPSGPGWVNLTLFGEIVGPSLAGPSAEVVITTTAAVNGTSLYFGGTAQSGITCAPPLASVDIGIVYGATWPFVNHSTPHLFNLTVDTTASLAPLYQVQFYVGSYGGWSWHYFVTCDPAALDTYPGDDAFVGSYTYITVLFDLPAASLTAVTCALWYSPDCTYPFLHCMCC